jgi:hypothetical protein
MDIPGEDYEIAIFVKRNHLLPMGHASMIATRKDALLPRRRSTSPHAKIYVGATTNHTE